MAPSDDDGVDCVNFGPSTGLLGSKLSVKNTQVKTNVSGANSQSIKINFDGEKAYDTVAGLEERDLKIILEEVVSRKQPKNDKSEIVQALIRNAEDAIREESGSGDDTIDLDFCRHKKKRSSCRREQCSAANNSAASRNNTGGSLGSLHNISDPKVPERKICATQGVASRSRAGGSCGNLSKSSFETHAGKRRSRQYKEVAKASASQREGGSLQNLNKEAASSSESKKLQKSGSLSQVFSEVGGLRSKTRRQKTTSESSSSRLHSRRSEDREADESSEGEATYDYPSAGGDVVDGKIVGSVVNYRNVDYVSNVASGDNTEDEESMRHIVASNIMGDSLRTSTSTYGRHDSSEGLSAVTYSVDQDRKFLSDNDVAKAVQFGLSRNQDEVMTSSITSSCSYGAPCATSVVDGKIISGKDEDVSDKRKLRATKSDNGSFDKTSLDENGNPISVSTRNNLCSTTTDRHSTTISAISRRNGFGSSRDASVYDRLKAKQDKKKANKEKDVIAVEKVPGFRGYEPLDNILKFLGADDSSNGKPKRKSKGGKKDEEVPKRRCKDKTDDEADEDKKKKLKKKKSSGVLRESSSVEDLVSKCKQNDSGIFRKQRTVDDGNLRSPYRLQVSEPIETEWSKESETETPSNVESEFSYDFYNVGDPTLDSDLLHDDFEVVGRKKGRRSKANMKTSNDRRSKGSSSHQINFSEAPRTPHEGTFLSQWSVNRGSAGFSATTSAPHSEDSDSDGGDSVHSMPANTITPKPRVRKPPPSTDSTPQTSYANIAKLASKPPQRKNPNNSSSADDEDIELHDLKNDSSILDENFPPLSFSSGVSSGPNSSMSDIVTSPTGDVIKKPSVVSLASSDPRKIKHSPPPIDLASPPSGDLNRNNKFSPPPTVNNPSPAVEMIRKSKNCATSNEVVPCSFPSAVQEIPPVPATSSPSSVTTLQKASSVPSSDNSAPTDTNSSVSERQVVVNKEPKPKSRKLNNNIIMENDATRLSTRKYEPAVIFPDNAKFDTSATGLEFGFDVSLDSLPDSNSLTLLKPSIEATHCNRTDNNNIKNLNKKDFSKLYKAPKNDIISYNYEELRKHVSKAWESTLRMMEEDPKNIQYWQATGPIKKI